MKSIAWTGRAASKIWWIRTVFGPMALGATALIGCGGGSPGNDDTRNPSVAPPAVNVSGVWQTTWGSQSAKMTLTQAGSDVSGMYEMPIGTIDPYYEYGSVEGTLSGRTLTGEVADKYGTTSIRFDFAIDGKSFSGKYGSSGSWNGKRSQ